MILPLDKWSPTKGTLLEELQKAAKAKGKILCIETTGIVDANTAQVVADMSKHGCCAVILPWLGKHSIAGLSAFIQRSNLPVVLPETVSELEANCCLDPELQQAGHAPPGQLPVSATQQHGPHAARTCR